MDCCDLALNYASSYFVRYTSLKDARKFVKTRRRSRSVLTNFLASERLVYLTKYEERHNWTQLWHLQVIFKEKKQTLSPSCFCFGGLAVLLTPTITLMNHWFSENSSKYDIFTYFTDIVVYSQRKYIHGFADFVTLLELSEQFSWLA